MKSLEPSSESTPIIFWDVCSRLCLDRRPFSRVSSLADALLWPGCEVLSGMSRVSVLTGLRASNMCSVHGFVSDSVDSDAHLRLRGITIAAFNKIFSYKADFS